MCDRWNTLIEQNHESNSLTYFQPFIHAMVKIYVFFRYINCFMRSATAEGTKK